MHAAIATNSHTVWVNLWYTVDSNKYRSLKVNSTNHSLLTMGKTILLFLFVAVVTAIVFYFLLQILRNAALYYKNFDIIRTP